MKEAIERYLSRTGYTEFSPKLALFDMDGVLYNTMPCHAEAWHDSMATYGLDMSLEEAYACEGMLGVETIKKITREQWQRDISMDEAKEMYLKKLEFFSKYPKAGLIPNIKDLHQTLKENNIKIGVVTGSGQPSLLNRILNDFADYVSPDIIVTANDVTHGKPAPDPYKKGMEKGGCAPYETIVIENAPLGVTAGVAAGCFTIAVNTGPLKDKVLKDAGADLVLKNMLQAKDILSPLTSTSTGIMKTNDTSMTPNDTLVTLP